MKKISTALFCLLLSTLSQGATALDRPTPGHEDKRILTTQFKSGEVYPINAVNGLITTVIFARGEEVLSFGSGFSTAWEFASRGNHFFMKPRGKEGTTNLVVVTNRRTYFFDVKLTGNRKNATYRLLFEYPDEAAVQKAAAAEKELVQNLLNQSEIPAGNETVKTENRTYTMNFGSDRESRRIAPSEAYDNGRFTYLLMNPNTDFPAAYRVSAGQESLINSHVEGNWLVIHGVYEEIRLRAGNAVVGIYNERFSGGTAETSGVSVPGLEREIVSQGEEPL